MSTKDILTLIISGIGVAVAAVVATKSFIEYRLQGSAKRSEIFLNLRSRLRCDPGFVKICALLEKDDPALSEIPLIERDRFIGFFEELAILANSGLVNESVTFYMFGYFAIRCLDSTNFWINLNRKHDLWSAFMDFAEQMKETQRNFIFKKDLFHL
jgi:hypothetical protein